MKEITGDEKKEVMDFYNSTGRTGTPIVVIRNPETGKERTFTVTGGEVELYESKIGNNQ